MIGWLRRNWRQVAAAAGLAAALVALLFAVASIRRLRSSGGQLVAQALSGMLDREVEVGRVELGFGLSLEVEIWDLRVLDRDDPDAPPVFEARYARGRQGWPRLLVGQLVPLDWELEAPVLRLGDGAGDGPGPDLSRLPRVDIDVREGRIEWRPQSGEPFTIDALVMQARRARFVPGLAGRGRGRLVQRGAVLSWFDLEFDGRVDDFALSGSVSDLDLSKLPLAPLGAVGKAVGEIVVGVHGDSIESRMSLEVAGLELRLPEFRAPLVPETNRLTLDLGWHQGEFDLLLHRLELDDLVVRGQARVRTEPEPHLVADLELDGFELAGGSRINLLRLLALRFDSWAHIARRVEGGRIDQLGLKLDAPLSRLPDVFAFRDRVRPEEFTFQASVHDGVYRADPNRPPIEEIEGALTIHGNVLELEELTMSRDGWAFPQIDLRIDGMHRFVRLPAEERRRPNGPGAALPGLVPAGRMVRRGLPSEGAANPLRFRDLELHYRPFLLPLREAQGEVRVARDTLEWKIERGVLGGVPAEALVVWNPDARSVDADIRYLDGDAEPLPEGWTEPDEWLRANVSTDRFNLGGWSLENAEARLAVSENRMRLADIGGSIDGGAFAGEGWLSLANHSDVPFELRLLVDDADVASFCEPMLISRGTLEGRVGLTGRVGGRLDPVRRFVESADFDLDFAARDGTVRNLPAVMVLARLPSLAGVRGLLGRPLPYDRIELQLNLHDGVLEIRDFKLSGAELRALASGTIDLASESKEADVIVALLFLETVDKLIGAIPIVGDMLLGEDQNLLSTWFRVDGPWNAPRAHMMAPAAISAAAGAITGTIRTFIELLPLPESSPPKDGAGDAGAGSTTDDRAGEAGPGPADGVPQ